MEINKNITSIERKFNIAGSIPLISLISGQLRYMAGAIQAIAGAAFALIGWFGQTIRPSHKKWAQMNRLGVEHMLHGPMNILRGMGEGLIGATLILPIGLGIYQIPSGFSPIVPYELST